MLVRVFRLFEYNTALSRDSDTLFGENVLVHAYNRITPTNDDIYNDAKRSIASISYAVAIRTLGRIIAMQERARQTGMPEDQLTDPQEGLPFVTVYEVHDRRRRYRVHRPHMIAKPTLDNYRMDTVVWEDYDYKLREAFASYPSQHTSEARRDIRKVFVEASRCMVTRKRVDRCMCNICKEMRGLPTEPSIPGYQLVHVSSNMSEYTNDILSDNYDEERRDTPDANDNGDSSSDDSGDSRGDNAHGPEDTDYQNSGHIDTSGHHGEQYRDQARSPSPQW